MRIDNQALIISTLKLSGVQQMALDLHFLDKTISEVEILFTLRFYHWEGSWISIGYHQKEIPIHWEKLLEKGVIKIVRRPSGGGAVLHSGGITYALTFKKNSYKSFSYELVNNWLIKSFNELGLPLARGHLKKSLIKENCFGSSYVSDLVDQFGFKRIGSAQYRKKGAFLQHGEIQLKPPRELWIKLFGEEPPPSIDLSLTNEKIIKYLRNSFLETKSNLKIENINYKKNEIKDLI
ncbi:protein ligase [Prochlorococcus sp. AH-716-K03]|nr:protein ligase [Prochlorococcus sp. AH-716-K03]